MGVRTVQVGWHRGGVGIGGVKWGRCRVWVGGEAGWVGMPLSISYHGRV